ncbi:hypothetical protein ACHHYP_13723 [Achlya hypogyna]|uniref:Uncharacterized protein n=1 Tax=Achlya hypogyna TaxID=1202772 RepID=A0A1V9YES8_ACHHY|nr:hypothetical protein ACHHYP_13723 [Achlya hypogyna]
MGLTTSTYVATTGTCASVPAATVASTNCAGQWNAAASVCTVQKPSYTAAQCASDMGVWTYKAGYEPNPCACTSGSGCPTSKICTTCLINGVCTSAFPVTADCLMFNNGARWCGK